MTDYFLVTKEELDQIKNDCANPEYLYCEGCEYEDVVVCNFKGANVLMDEVMTRPLEAELKKAGEKATNEFMKAIDWRFNDTEKGKLIIKTIQEIKDNLTHKEYPDADGLQEFPFRSIPRGKP